MSWSCLKLTLTQIVLYSILTLFTPLMQTVFAAGSAVLSWNPNTENDLAGYNIYHGTASGQYKPHRKAPRE